MTMAEQRIGDEEISAWVDGELCAADAARVQAWLDTHPEDAARARRWLADREALRALLAPSRDEAVPAALHDLVMRRANPPHWARPAAAASGLWGWCSTPGWRASRSNT